MASRRVGVIASGAALVALAAFVPGGCQGGEGGDQADGGHQAVDDVPRCGDGVCHPCEGDFDDDDCEFDDTPLCAEDCPYCGDGVCSEDEELSPYCEDCDGCCDYDAGGCECGDGCCEAYEDCLEDCGYECGDGICDDGEDPYACIDCSCGDGVCDEVFEDKDVCPEDCDPCFRLCGNGICDADCETPATCRDCPASCSHDVCNEGPALASSCSPCVDQICAADATCCARTWGNGCVKAAMTLCPRLCP